MGCLTLTHKIIGEEHYKVGEKMATDTTKIKQMIIKIASEEGVDPALALAVAENESGFNPKAHNKTTKEDSIGLYQINRMAHPDYKGGTDVEANIRYGVKYLKGQLAKAKGNKAVALAAYNGGWGGRNSSQAKGYAQKVLSIANKKYDKVSKNNELIATNYNEAIKQGQPTGAASGINMNVPDPERPNYTSLFNNTEVDPTGASKAQLTQREVMALRNLAAPIEPIPDIRPRVVIGTNEDGTSKTVSAGEYNQMLNDLDTQRMMQMTANTQAQLPDLARTEVQLGGQNAYDTLRGLYNEYGQMLENDPRAQLARLTPEQAREVMSDIRNDFNWGGNRNKLSRADMYKMMNALENQQMDYNDAMSVAQDKYNRQLAAFQQLQKDALTLAGNNQQLANEIVKQAVSGNGDVITALQKTQQARIEKEADYQKEQLSGYNTLRNTQLQGINTALSQLPQTEQSAINNFNTFKNQRYAGDVAKYGRDVGAVVDLSLPEVKANAELPLETAKLQQNQQKIGIAQQNADTARAVGAGNIISNGMFNPQGFTTASQTVPVIRNILGAPTTETSNTLFGLTPNIKGSTPKMMDFFGLFNND